jgi:exodeoxyribonuclease VII large subunit
VVSSAQAAAWRDVTAALARRAAHVPITLYPTPVQGDGAPAQIAAAIRRAGRSAARDGTDVLLLVRGGGSLEDLAAFNSEAVARAIRACPLPVVVGVGHETDVSIADFAADLRAATPTAAAELASAGFVELHDKLALLDARLTRAMQRRVETAAQRLDRVAARLTHPRQRLVQAGLRLETLTQALRARMARQLAAGEARWAPSACASPPASPTSPSAGPASMPSPSASSAPAATCWSAAAAASTPSPSTSPTSTRGACWPAATASPATPPARSCATPARWPRRRHPGRASPGQRGRHEPHND